MKMSAPRELPFWISAWWDFSFGTLQWLHYERNGILNHQPQDCLTNCLFKAQIKETSKLCHWPGVWNSPVPGEFPAQRSSNGENVSIWWHHHEMWLKSHMCGCSNMPRSLWHFAIISQEQGLMQIEWINQSLKSQNVPVPYPTRHCSEQKCAHFCSEQCIVGYGTGAFWDLWDRSIAEVWHTLVPGSLRELKFSYSCYELPTLPNTSAVCISHCKML